MSSRNKASKAKAKPPTTMETAEAEPKAPTTPRNAPISLSNLIEKLGAPLVYLTLAAISSSVSQAVQAPVFGALPSAVYHREAVIAAAITGFLLRALVKTPSPGQVAKTLAAWSFWIPSLQWLLFGFSGTLGPGVGPAVISLLGNYSFIIAAAYSAAEALDVLQLEAMLGPYAATILLAAAGVYHVVSFEAWFQQALPRFTQISDIFTPVQLQLVISASLAYMAPSQLLVVTTPAIIHTMFFNPHYDSATALSGPNDKLFAQNWTLIDRQWSVTGYLSVLENFDEKYRVMRCDHSLLGGEWLLTDERRDREGWSVNEPIYSVFEMLEAVRLIEGVSDIRDAHAHALVVGLGIGTAPKAMLAHGINTTIVELDPVVHEYATKYFGLPANHTAIIEDAVFWVSEAATNGTSKYDYIIHDVFTGGAEPLSPFTDTFLHSLRSLLKPNGAIALNYAGDLNMPLTSTVLNTIDKVFIGQCQIYRDTPAESAMAGDKAAVNEDFTNFVIFCRNSPGAITFRKPRAADFLRSKSREHYMLPDAKFEVSFPSRDSSGRPRPLDVLKAGDEAKWAKQQAESATKHWYVMRKVLPDIVWELW